jgi:hypothetical protein
MITGLGPEWRHRTLLREVNERIFALTQELAPGADGDDLPIMVFCECGIDGCMPPIEMTVPEINGPSPVVTETRAEGSSPD